MNKIILKGLLSCVVMSQVLAGAVDNGDVLQSIKTRLGRFYNKSVLATPPKNGIVYSQADILSPGFKNAVQKQNRVRQELNKTTQKLNETTQEISLLNDQITTLQHDLQNKELTLDEKEKLNKKLEQMVGQLDSEISNLANMYLENMQKAEKLEINLVLNAKMVPVIEKTAKELKEKIDSKAVDNQSVDNQSERRLIDILRGNILAALNSPETRKAIKMDTLYNDICSYISDNLQNPDSELKDLKDFKLTLQQEEQIRDFYVQFYNDVDNDLLEQIKLFEQLRSPEPKKQEDQKAKVESADESVDDEIADMDPTK